MYLPLFTEKKKRKRDHGRKTNQQCRGFLLGVVGYVLASHGPLKGRRGMVGEGEKGREGGFPFFFFCPPTRIDFHPTSFPKHVAQKGRKPL